MDNLLNIYVEQQNVEFRRFFKPSFELLVIHMTDRTRNVKMSTFLSGLPLAALMVLALCMPAQINAQVLTSRVVEVRTNVGNAMVYADSVYIGRASDQFFSLSRSAKVLRLVPPNLDSWSMSPLVADLETAVGDSLVFDLDFQYHYRIESVPYDAQVFIETPGERILLGDTPLLYAIDDPIRGMLLVTKSGFEPLRITPGEKIWNQHYINLEDKIEEEELAKAFWQPGNKSTRWIDYVAGGVALASGIMAVRYKTKADRRYARYENSGDPVLRPGFERYDTYSAVALGTMQVGIGVIAVRLVLK